MTRTPLKPNASRLMRLMREGRETPPAGTSSPSPPTDAQSATPDAPAAESASEADLGELPPSGIHPTPLLTTVPARNPITPPSTPTSWPRDAERELWADICKDSFPWFFRVAWGIHFNKKAASFTPRIHDPICEWFERKGKEWLAARNNREPRTKYLAPLLPREFWKTSLTGAFLLWLHLQDPDLSTFIGSETTTQAEDWFGPARETMRGEGYGWFTWLYGNWEAKNRRWSNAEVVHGARRDATLQAPSFGTWGVATGLTGYHPDVLDLDDPTSYDRLEKDTGWLDTVNAHCVSLGPVLKANGLMVWPGTRYGAGDHYGMYFDKLGVREVEGMPFPDHYSHYIKKDGLFEVYFLQGRFADRTPTFPEQWPEWRLLREEKLSSLKYAAQIMNDPASSEYNPLNMSQVNDCWIEGRHVPYAALRFTFHCDTAFRYSNRQARGDESVIIVFGHHPGTGDVYYIEGYGSPVWRAEDFGDRLVSLVQKYRARRWRVSAITDEQEVGGKGGTWEALLRSYFHAANMPMPPIMFFNRSGTGKIPRMVTAAGYWADGHVKLVRGSNGVEKLIHQMTTLGPGMAHDDWADAASDVFHKDIYTAMRRLGVPGESPAGSDTFPGDEWLKTGVLTNNDLIRLYDEDGREADRGYEPV